GVVLGIDDVDVSLAVTANGFRPVEGRLAGVAAVAGVALGTGPRHRADAAGGVDLADAVALALADVGDALAVHAHRPRAAQHGVRRRPAVADAAAVHFPFWPAGAGERGDDAGLQIEPADAPVADVRDQQAALAVE